MLEWLIGAGGMATAALLWRRGRRGRTPVLGPGRALPSSALVERLRPLLEAIDAVQAVADEVTAEDLRRCAPVGTAPLWGDERAGPSARDDADRLRIAAGAGPGPQRFIALYGALAAVSDDDRRTLAEAGFDLARLTAALEPRDPAEGWRDDLRREFAALRSVLAQVRRRPYR